VNTVENWSIFDEVIRRTKMCQFLDHPVYRVRQRYTA